MSDGEGSDISDAPQKKVSGIFPLGLLKSEAVLIAFASGAAYFFAYSFERGFLSYFGVEAVFVQVAPNDFLLICSAIATFVLLIWIVLGIMPVRAIEPILKAMLIFGPLFGLLLPGIFSYYLNGVNWLAIIYFIVSLVFIGFLATSLFFEFWRGSSFNEWVKSQIQSELSAQGKFVTPTLMSKLHVIQLCIVIFVALSSPVATFLGRSYADGLHSFQGATLEGKLYAIISDYYDGYLAVEVLEVKSGRYALKGSARWLPRENLSEIDLLLFHSFDGLSDSDRPRFRATFAMFWEDNFGRPFGIDRR